MKPEPAPRREITPGTEIRAARIRRHVVPAVTSPAGGAGSAQPSCYHGNRRKVHRRSRDTKLAQTLYKYKIQRRPVQRTVPENWRRQDPKTSCAAHSTRELAQTRSKDVLCSAQYQRTGADKIQRRPVQRTVPENWRRQDPKTSCAAHSTRELAQTRSKDVLCSAQYQRTGADKIQRRPVQRTVPENWRRQDPKTSCAAHSTRELAQTRSKDVLCSAQYQRTGADKIQRRPVQRTVPENWRRQDPKTSCAAHSTRELAQTRSKDVLCSAQYQRTGAGAVIDLGLGVTSLCFFSVTFSRFIM
ncbi:uncharacterized protein [Engystomops pustulosus]|uniref:uncharacterized protein n=1 Tax=Engystomops pustulosus TaxID=76066 RepID=UPI003AFA7019